MKNLLRKMKGLATACVGSLVAFSLPTFAALDAAVTDLITGLITDVGLLFAATVALWAAIRGFMAVYKLGNKFISKAGA